MCFVRYTHEVNDFFFFPSDNVFYMFQSDVNRISSLIAPRCITLNHQNRQLSLLQGSSLHPPPSHGKLSFTLYSFLVNVPPPRYGHSSSNPVSSLSFFTESLHLTFNFMTHRYLLQYSRVSWCLVFLWYGVVGRNNGTTSRRGKVVPSPRE